MQNIPALRAKGHTGECWNTKASCCLRDIERLIGIGQRDWNHPLSHPITPYHPLSPPISFVSTSYHLPANPIIHYHFLSSDITPHHPMPATITRYHPLSPPITLHHHLIVPSSTLITHHSPHHPQSPTITTINLLSELIRTYIIPYQIAWRAGVIAADRNWERLIRVDRSEKSLIGGDRFVLTFKVW